MSTTTRAPHFRADLPGSVGYVAVMVRETLIHLPRLWRLGSRYRRRQRPEEPHVLLVGDNLDGVHGISTSSMRLVSDLRARGRRASMMGIRHSSRPAGPRNADGSAFMIDPSCVQDLFGYEGQELAYPSLSALCDHLERDLVDVVELESPGTFSLVWVALAPWLGVKLVHNYRTDLVSYFRTLLGNPLFIAFLIWYVRRFLGSGGHVIVPSGAFLDEVVALGIPRRTARLLPRGVDTSRFRPDRRDLEAWTSRGAPRGPVVAFLGRVSLEKGLDVLEEAFRLVLVRRPDAVLGVIGEGPYRATFQERLSDTGRACFAGETVGDELPRLLASCDVLAFPSTTDTFGNAVLEALASGVPAVVTDQGGPREIVQDGRSGLVVPGRDPEALAGAILALLDDPARHAVFAREAVRRADDFRPDVATERHWQFYRAVHRGEPV